MDEATEVVLVLLVLKDILAILVNGYFGRSQGG